MDRKRLEAFVSISRRANLVVYSIFFLFGILSFRLWYLSVANATSYKTKAFHSRTLTVRDPAMRGTIRDRFHVVLAANVIDYRVGISWGSIQEIPRTVSRTTFGATGEKIYLRKEYIKALAKILAEELSLDQTRIEDVIHSYAIFSSATPFFFTTGLTEKQYYRLNMLAKDWPGIVVERIPRRVYPQETVGSHIVGYIASQNREEYDSLLLEKTALQEYLHRVEQGEDVPLLPGYPSYFAAKERFLVLERKSYTMSDAVGKSGVEAAFEGSLRGLSGKKCFVTNAQGEIIRQVVGSKDPVSGKRLVLSLSSELQRFCEELLAQDEKVRGHRHNKEEKKYPFISGGAIVALDPISSDVIACASHPEFNPNDFVRLPHAFFDEKGGNAALSWTRGEVFYRDMWNGEGFLEGMGKKRLSWSVFLEGLLPKKSVLHTLLSSSTTIETLILRQKAWRRLSEVLHEDMAALPERLAEISEEDVPPEMRKSYRMLKTCLDACSTHKEKLLFFDLCRLLIQEESVSPLIETKLASFSIDAWRATLAAKEYFLRIIKKLAEASFRAGPFTEWRKEHGVEFLKEKRLEEKTKKLISRPYLYYFDKECARQFGEWWQTQWPQLIYSLFSGRGEIPLWLENTCVKNLRELACEKEVLAHMKMLSLALRPLSGPEGAFLLSCLRGYDELSFPLLGEYSVGVSGKDVVRSFFSLFPSTMASFAFMQPHPQGSIFKLTVAHAALQKRLGEVDGDPEKLDPTFFTMTDKTFFRDGRLYVGFDNRGKPIPQFYKGGRVPKSVESDLGQLDLVKAIEHSSNPYFALLAGDYLENPETLLFAAKSLGYGQRTGIFLPNEARGKVPSDLEENKTGVYTTAIGQHTLLVTPLQTSVALAALFSKEVVVPKILRMAVGAESPLLQGAKSQYEELMRNVGVFFPLWIADAAEMSKRGLFVSSKTVRRRLPIPSREQDILRKGMRKVCERLFVDQRLRNHCRHHPSLWSAFEDEGPFMIGKSSTAQSLERIGIGAGQKPSMYNHVWFAGIFFGKEPGANTVSDKPELVVVVFLRYGTSGKEAAPLAASVAREWRRIQARHAH